MSNPNDINQVLDQILGTIKDTATAQVVSDFKTLLQEAGQSAEAIAQETAQRMSRWLAMQASGQLTPDEVKYLLEAQKNEVLIALNTLSIAERAHIQDMLEQLLNTALSVIVKVIGVV